MATVKDVAREAGVSLGTVSNVLNGKKGVKPESQKKVYQAIKKLGFQYNMTASALRTKTTKTIGLIIPTIVNPYYPELARGAEDEARKEGFTVFLCNSDRDVKKEMHYVNTLLSRGTDGVILVKSKLAEEELERLKLWTQVVLVDYEKQNREESSERFHMVNVDDAEGVIQGIELLEQYGHSRIAFISGLQDEYSSRCRMETYQDCLRKRGIPLRKEYVITGDFSWQSGYKAAKQLFSLEERPTAIFAANDIMAIGALKAALEAGIRVPEELSILGYDDIEMSNLCSPSLTTIHQPKYQVGIEAVRMLMQNLNKQPDAENCLCLKTKPVLRKSVAAAQR